MRGERTYKGSTPCPCDDCNNHDYCMPNAMSCKVSRYWESMGNVLIKKGILVDRVPDQRLSKEDRVHIKRNKGGNS